MNHKRFTSIQAHLSDDQWKEKMQWAKNQYGKFHLNARKYFYFNPEVFQHCHRLPKGAMESPCLEEYDIWLDMILSSVCEGCCPDQGVWPRPPPQIPPTSPLLWFCDVCPVHSKAVVQNNNITHLEKNQYQWCSSDARQCNTKLYYSLYLCVIIKF